MKHLVQFSLGIGSGETTYRVVEQFGLDAVELLTADTLVEDEDNWRYGREVVADLGSPTWTVLRDGRTPMEVGRDAQGFAHANCGGGCGRDGSRQAPAVPRDARQGRLLAGIAAGSLGLEVARETL